MLKGRLSFRSSSSSSSASRGRRRRGASSSDDGNDNENGSGKPKKNLSSSSSSRRRVDIGSSTAATTATTTTVPLGGNNHNYNNNNHDDDGTNKADDDGRCSLPSIIMPTTTTTSEAKMMMTTTKAPPSGSNYYSKRCRPSSSSSSFSYHHHHHATSYDRRHGNDAPHMMGTMMMTKKNKKSCCDCSSSTTTTDYQRHDDDNYYDNDDCSTATMTILSSLESSSSSSSSSSRFHISNHHNIIDENSNIIGNANANNNNRPRWSVGKISLIILVVFTLTDVVLNCVDAQMDSLGRPLLDDYDALSADVIRPAFKYNTKKHHNQRGGVTSSHSSSGSSSSSSKSMGLGSAAISSITTTLSPILPFAGGIDLRREDYWKATQVGNDNSDWYDSHVSSTSTVTGWFTSLSSVVHQVREAYGYKPDSDEDEDDDFDETDTLTGTSLDRIPRGGAAVMSRTKKQTGNNKRSKKSSPKTVASMPRSFIMSNPEPFVPFDDIAQLTLKDVAMSFRYAVESTRKEFQSNKFVSQLNKYSQKVIDGMAKATSKARGKFVQAPITGEKTSSPESSTTATPFVAGDVDALTFCAAMRVFAEWRVLRQVPPGYKGYAVGISLGQKDIVQNIAKIEQAIHGYADHRAQQQRDLMAQSNKDGSDDDDTTTSSFSMKSPTLRELLQYEVDADIQDVSKLPRLKEKSAAMGLLWVRRQLQYQTTLFANVVDVPKRFSSTVSAVQSAYDEVYHNYHGWAVQKIFSYSFQAAPDASVIYNYMNPRRLEEVQDDARRRFYGDSSNHHHHGRKSTQNFEDDYDSSNNPFERFGNHIGREWDKLAGNVVNEWDKVARNVGQLFGQQAAPTVRYFDETFGSAPSTDEQAAKALEMESYINKEMERNAHENILAYLDVAYPILDDLSTLFDEFNMNDPTKV